MQSPHALVTHIVGIALFVKSDEPKAFGVAVAAVNDAGLCHVAIAIKLAPKVLQAHNAKQYEKPKTKTQVWRVTFRYAKQVLAKHMHERYSAVWHLQLGSGRCGRAVASRQPFGAKMAPSTML